MYSSTWITYCYSPVKLQYHGYYTHGFMLPIGRCLKPFPKKRWAAFSETDADRLCCACLQYAYAGPVVYNVNKTPALIDSVQEMTPLGLSDVYAGVWGCLLNGKETTNRYPRWGEGDTILWALGLLFCFSLFPLMHSIGQPSGIFLLRCISTARVHHTPAEFGIIVDSRPLFIPHLCVSFQ